MAQLFGFEIKRKDTSKEQLNVRSFAEPVNDEGAISIAAGSTQSTYVDLDGTAKTEADLVNRYRSMLQQPEVQAAVDDIVNEAINITDEKQSIECVTDDLEYPDSIKKKIREEFDTILKLLDFNNQGYEIFTRWYVDGRLYYHVMIDESSPKKGIQELRYVDPRKIRKVREFERDRNVNSGVGIPANQFPIKKVKNEYYVYTERGYDVNSANIIGSLESIQGLKVAKDSIINCNSGVLNEKNTIILSHLHKAYKPLNQLRMMEDSLVIYRLARAPERRIFYIDVGNLPKVKAEQYLREMMVNHKNKLVYDASTGEMRDDRKFMTITDDFWLPRREGNRGTEITTLPGGQNLGEMDDVVYFQKKLYKSLNVPISRLEPETGFSLGRSSEISRDEVKFNKFIRRLRARFSNLFDKALEKQLVLKGIIKPDEWPEIREKIRYNFQLDNHFEELKQAEILRDRIDVLTNVSNFVGDYYSKDWVRKNVLHMTEDEIEEMKKQIDTEAKEEPPVEPPAEPPAQIDSNPPQPKPNPTQQ
jgi:hypothetical protein